MIKHIYNVYGIASECGSLFTGTCVSDDIINAIELFRKNGYSVWNIKRGEQVNNNLENSIKNINIFGGYSAESKSERNIYSLYKRIMKRDPRAIGDIQTLDEAKEIIKMITGSTQGIKIDNGLYPMDFDKVVEIVAENSHRWNDNGIEIG